MLTGKNKAGDIATIKYHFVPERREQYTFTIAFKFKATSGLAITEEEAIRVIEAAIGKVDWRREE